MKSEILLDFSLEYDYAFGKHRSGWKYAMSGFKQYNISSNAIHFCSIFEKQFFEPTQHAKCMLEKEWISIMHVPPLKKELEHHPRWFHKSPLYFLQDSQIQDQLKNCKGLFTLSNYHKDWLKNHSLLKDIQIESLILPTEGTESQWEYEAFINNTSKSIINIGHFLRRWRNFYKLRANNFSKWILPNVSLFLDIENQLFGKVSDSSTRSVDMSEYVSNHEYDQLLSKNIVFLDLHNSSANNVIIECIVRNTPLMVNPTGGVPDYLGADYPFYYNSLREAEEKLNNLELIKATHEYLKTLKIKEKMTTDYFVQSILDSAIYKGLEDGRK